MIPAKYNLTILQGSSFQRWFALKTPAGTVMNLATTGGGYTIGKATIRDRIGGNVMLQLTTAGGGVSLTYAADANGTFWSGYIQANAAQTAVLVPWGRGVWDLEISNGTHTYRIFEGYATLSPEVSS